MGIQRVGLWCLVAFWVHTSWALTPTESWVVDRPPTPAALDLWNRIQTPRFYVATLADPSGSELEALAELPHSRGLDVVMSSMPSESTLPALWRLSLVEGSRWTGFSSEIPTDYETDLIAELPFASRTLVVQHYPSPTEAQRLNRLITPGSTNHLVFAMRAYPRMIDRPGLEALSAQFDLTIATDYWPSYFHMDVLNLLPHDVRIRVRGMDPPDETFPFLTHIRRLKSVLFERQEPMVATLGEQKQFWARFATLPLRWTAVGHVPDATAIAAFDSYENASELIVDRDDELSTSELKALTASRLPTRWIHIAPSYGH